MTGPIPAAGAAVIDGDRILLVQRGREPQLGRWAVPGGKQLLGETQQGCAAREVFEETGLIVEIGEPLWVGDSIGPGEPPAWHFAIVDFLATPTGGVLAPADDALDARWVTIDEARQLPLTTTMPHFLDVVTDRLGL